MSESFKNRPDRFPHDRHMHTTTHPCSSRYDELRSGFNLAVEHTPGLIVEPARPEEVAAAVAAATSQGRPVAVLNTGHGPATAAGADAVMIRTSRLRGVHVDPTRRTVRVGAGERWADVIAAAARHGLAPLNGSSPHVGVVGYTLGGGVGHLGRRFGFAADHVRSIDVVTADGRHRTADQHHETDLFWALRGAGANFGVVTSIEMDLFEVRELVGGELCFGPAHADAVVHAYADWAADAPESMASSLLVMRFPDDDTVPAPLRGAHVCHIRVADSGADHRAAFGRVAALRRIGPRLVDSVRVMPYAQVGSIHHEPTDHPVAAYDRNVLLHSFDHDAAAVVHKFAGPSADAPFLVEVRAWGGALARPPAAPNAIGGRDAAFSLLAISGADDEERARRDELLDAMSPWATGMRYLNFCGVEDAADVARCYRADDLTRLAELKATFDPSNTFRANFNIRPERTAP
jgi:FAD/FMN-containing dehydrogenase